MIKKNTKAVYIDGGYQGEYDWQGGIPLSVGETMTVTIDNQDLVYELTDKKVCLDAESDDQIVEVISTFKLIA